MRRIVMFNRVTADGYFAAIDGGLDWAVPDEQIENEAVRGMQNTDTILFGRKTYDAFEGFWPHALDDAATGPDPHAAGRRSSGLHAMAVWINEATKIVFSRTRKTVTWRGSRLIPELDPAAVEALKKGPGKDMMLFGSGSIVSQLTLHGLIDEYQFVVSPVLLGSGRTLLGDLASSRRLDLLEVKQSPSGNVTLRYAPRS